MRRKSSDKAMTVLLDTGAPGFFVSESRLQELTKEMGWEPRYVSLVLGDRSRLLAKLETMPGDSTDFLMGVDLLHKYEALVNYSGHSVTFRRGGMSVRVPTWEVE